MQFLVQFFGKISNWKSLILLALIYLFFSMYLLKNAESKINALAGKEVGVIDLTFGYNTEKTTNMVVNYGEEARNYYAQVETTIDIAYPIVYAILFGIILTMLYRGKSVLNLLVFLPLITMLFDILENMMIVRLLKSYPDTSNLITHGVELFKLGKWGLFGILIIATIIGLYNKLTKRI